ncbi:HIRAN domain-containing protein [Roseibium sp.]|uniref:HIRAN domain-containing protein n=1 Tax=Roseibium sp. TaxID=1936156 RepID=UPI003297D772
MIEILAILLVASIIAALVLWKPDPTADAERSPAIDFQLGKPYFTEIVDDFKYQGVIQTLRQGEDVEIVLEPDHPYDPNALCVRTMTNDPIGYIARNSWLRIAIALDGRGCNAWVDKISSQSKGLQRVNIGVVLTAGPIEERRYVKR